jgi:hypothetical protein
MLLKRTQNPWLRLYLIPPSLLGLILQISPAMETIIRPLICLVSEHRGPFVISLTCALLQWTPHVGFTLLIFD